MCIVFLQDRTALNCACFVWPFGCYAFINLWFHARVLDLLLRWHSQRPVCLLCPWEAFRWPGSCHAEVLGNPFLVLPCVLMPSSWLCLLSSWNPLSNEAPFPVGTWRTARGRLRFCSLTRLGALCTPWHSTLGRWLQYGSNYSEIGRHCPIVL